MAEHTPETSAYTSDIFDKVTHVQKGPIKIPQYVLDSVLRVKDLPIEGWAFVNRGSVIRDSKTNEVVIDTDDRIPAPPLTKQELELRPAVMQVMRVVADKAIGGYIVDFRHVGEFAQSDRGLEDGVESDQHREYQDNLKSRLPLGVIFAAQGEIHYIGDESFLDVAARFVASVDEKVSLLNSGDAVEVVTMLDEKTDTKQVPSQEES